MYIGNYILINRNLDKQNWAKHFSTPPWFVGGRRGVGLGAWSDLLHQTEKYKNPEIILFSFGHL